MSLSTLSSICYRLRHRLPFAIAISLLFVIYTLMALLTDHSVKADNRELLPQKEKVQSSEFYQYLRSRYGLANDAAPVETEANSINRNDTTDTTTFTKTETSQPEIITNEHAHELKPDTIQKKEPPQEQKTLPKKSSYTKPEPQTRIIKTVTANSQPSNDISAETVDLPQPQQNTNREFKTAGPDYYRGLYINNGFVRAADFKKFLDVAKNHHINVLVIDVQPRMPGSEILTLADEMGFYLVARVVVFPDGLKSYPAGKGQIERVVNTAETAAKAGFSEIQLDYIRFADNLHVKGLTLQKRYSYISSILTQFENRLRPYQVRIAADIFGRIPFNNHDIIGQKMEVFDAHLDVINPMLYPSHFYGDPFRRQKPYQTIRDGTLASKKRTRNSRIVPYIQAFGMRVGESGLSLQNYIRAQIDGASDSGGSGYIAWNARNDYSIFFKAVKAGRFMPLPKNK